MLLGAPVGDETAIDAVLSNKLDVFHLLANRLKRTRRVVPLEKLLQHPEAALLATLCGVLQQSTYFRVR